MATRKEREQIEEQDWNKIDDAVIKSGSFLLRYRNQILTALGVVVVLAGIYWAYNSFYIKPKTAEAQVAIFEGQNYFATGQDSLALYGNGNGYIGFEAIINEYGSTKVGDLAKAYAGLSYARMGKYEQALKYLQDFKGGDELITPAVKGTIGDCLVNTGKAKEAISHFEKAAKESNDALLSPIFYKKAAMVYRSEKNYDKVIEIFTKIKNEYINSPEAADADKFILEASIQKGSN